jgi:hypothetical protein
VAAVWATLLIYGLVAHGKRALWLLVVAPLALFWPAVLAWVYLVCTFGPDCM